jgi:hypothetical protein
MCACVCDISQSFTAVSAPGPRTPFGCAGEYSATARRAAVTRVRGGANLNCKFEIQIIFSLRYTAYRQLKFCRQRVVLTSRISGEVST